MPEAFSSEGGDSRALACGKYYKILLDHLFLAFIFATQSNPMFTTISRTRLSFLTSSLQAKGTLSLTLVGFPQ